MKRLCAKILFLSIVVFFPCRLSADDPNLEFAKIIIRGLNQEGSSHWEGGIIPQISGGMVVRGFMDVNGDGIADMLMRSSISMASLENSTWCLFVREQNGYRLVSQDVVLFGPRGVVRRKGDFTILTGISIKNQSIIIAQNRIEPDGTCETTVEYLSGYEETKQFVEHEDWPESIFRLHGEGFKLEPAEVISLKEFLTSEQPQWRPYSFNHGFEEQEMALPQHEREEMKENYFSPIDARKALDAMNAARKNLRGDDSRELRRGLIPSERGNLDERHHADVRNEKNPMFWIMAVFILIIIGSVWLFKNHK